MRSPRTTVAAAISATAAIAATAVIAAQPEPRPQPPQTQRPAAPDFTRMIVNALKETEGCLGVDIAQMGISNRAAIIAWFKDKAAAIRWYNHPTHHFLMRATGTDPAENIPLEHVDDDTPVMVIASIIMADEQHPPANPNSPMMPIHSIAIELYTPLPGGAMINGRLAPDDFPIQHMDGAPTAKPNRDTNTDPDPESRGTTPPSDNR